jgi:hypothetical protein
MASGQREAAQADQVVGAGVEIDTAKATIDSDSKLSDIRFPDSHSIDIYASSEQSPSPLTGAHPSAKPSTEMVVDTSHVSAPEADGHESVVKCEVDGDAGDAGDAGDGEWLQSKATKRRSPFKSPEHPQSVADKQPAIAAEVLSDNGNSDEVDDDTENNRTDDASQCEMGELQHLLSELDKVSKLKAQISEKINAIQSTTSARKAPNPCGLGVSVAKSPSHASEVAESASMKAPEKGGDGGMIDDTSKQKVKDAPILTDEAHRPPYSENTQAAVETLAALGEAVVLQRGDFSPPKDMSSHAEPATARPHVYRRIITSPDHDDNVNGGEGQQRKQAGEGIYNLHAGSSAVEAKTFPHSNVGVEIDDDNEDGVWTDDEGDRAIHTDTCVHVYPRDYLVDSEWELDENDIPELLTTADFSRMKFHALWKLLESCGWRWQKGKGLVSYVYLRPICYEIVEWNAARSAAGSPAPGNRAENGSVVDQKKLSEGTSSSSLSSSSSLHGSVGKSASTPSHKDSVRSRNSSKKVKTQSSKKRKGTSLSGHKSTGSAGAASILLSDLARDTHYFDSEDALIYYVELILQKRKRDTHTKSLKPLDAAGAHRRNEGGVSVDPIDNGNENGTDNGTDNGNDADQLPNDTKSLTDTKPLDTFTDTKPYTRPHWEDVVMSLPFPIVWQHLQEEGWHWDFGTGLVQNWYIKPDYTVKTGEVNKHKFPSEESVRKYVRNRRAYHLREKRSLDASMEAPSASDQLDDSRLSDGKHEKAVNSTVDISGESVRGSELVGTGTVSSHAEDCQDDRQDDRDASGRDDDETEPNYLDDFMTQSDPLIDGDPNSQRWQDCKSDWRLVEHRKKRTSIISTKYDDLCDEHVPVGGDVGEVAAMPAVTEGNRTGAAKKPSSRTGGKEGKGGMATAERVRTHDKVSTHRTSSAKSSGSSKSTMSRKTLDSDDEGHSVRHLVKLGRYKRKLELSQSGKRPTSSSSSSSSSLAAAAGSCDSKGLSSSNRAVHTENRSTSVTGLIDSVNTAKVTGSASVIPTTSGGGTICDGDGDGDGAGDDSDRYEHIYADSHAGVAQSVIKPPKGTSRSQVMDGREGGRHVLGGAGGLHSRPPSSKSALTTTRESHSQASASASATMPDEDATQPQELYHPGMCLGVMMDSLGRLSDFGGSNSAPSAIQTDRVDQVDQANHVNGTETSLRGSNRLGADPRTKSLPTPTSTTATATMLSYVKPREADQHENQQDYAYDVLNTHREIDIDTSVAVGEHRSEHSHTGVHRHPHHHHHRQSEASRPSSSQKASAKRQKSSKHEISKLFQSIDFVITGVGPVEKREALIKLIFKCGGKVLSDFDRKAAPISPKPASSSSSSSSQSLKISSSTVGKDADGEGGGNRTLILLSQPTAFRRRLYLLALAKGIPIVHFRYVFDCVESREMLTCDQAVGTDEATPLLPIDPYALPSGPAIYHPSYVFPLQEPQAQAHLEGSSQRNPREIFSGLRILNLVPQARAADWHELLAAAGAVVMPGSVYKEKASAAGAGAGASTGIGSDQKSITSLLKGLSAGSKIIAGRCVPVDLVLTDAAAYTEKAQVKYHQSPVGHGGDRPGKDSGMLEVLTDLQFKVLQHFTDNDDQSTKVVTLDWVNNCLQLSSYIEPAAYSYVPCSHLNVSEVGLQNPAEGTHVDGGQMDIPLFHDPREYTPFLEENFRLNEDEDDDYNALYKHEGCDGVKTFFEQGNRSKVNLFGLPADPVRDPSVYKKSSDHEGGERFSRYDVVFYRKSKGGSKMLGRILGFVSDSSGDDGVNNRKKAVGSAGGRMSVIISPFQSSGVGMKELTPLSLLVPSLSQTSNTYSTTTPSATPSSAGTTPSSTSGVGFQGVVINDAPMPMHSSISAGPGAIRQRKRGRHGAPLSTTPTRRSARQSEGGAHSDYCTHSQAGPLVLDGSLLDSKAVLLSRRAYFSLAYAQADPCIYVMSELWHTVHERCIENAQRWKDQRSRKKARRVDGINPEDMKKDPEIMMLIQHSQDY